ncbi:Transcription initiation factor TFIID subunit 5 [Ranunculus cassubicifolius]
MMHLRDLQNLEGVLCPSHLEEMEFAHSLRQRKVNIKICQYSYELLLQYLHKTQSITMLGIINEHINFQVKTLDSWCCIGKNICTLHISLLSIYVKKSRV